MIFSLVNIVIVTTFFYDVSSNSRLILAVSFLIKTRVMEWNNMLYIYLSKVKNNNCGLICKCIAVY
jgi:hypothetical protein